jgi:hypothetical protein
MTGVWLASYVVLWVLVVLLGALILVLFRQFGLRSLTTVEGISRDGYPIGAALSPPIGVDHGNGRRRKALMVFVSVACRPCHDLMPDLSSFLTEKRNTLEGFLVLPTLDSGDRNEPHCTEATVIRDDAAMERYRVRVTPFAYLIGMNGRVEAKGLVNRAVDLQNLWIQAESVSVHEIDRAREGSSRGRIRND